MDRLCLLVWYKRLSTSSPNSFIYFFRHKEGEKPDWHDDSRADDIKRILEGDVDTLLIETMGEYSDSNITPVYREEWISKYLSKAEFIYRDVDYMPFVFISLDPAAGGLKSRNAIVSCIYTSEGHQIVSLSFIVYYL